MSYIREYSCLMFILILFAFSSVSLSFSLVLAQEGSASTDSQAPAAEWIFPDETEQFHSLEEMPDLNEIRGFMRTGDGVAGDVGRSIDELGGEIDSVDAVGIGSISNDRISTEMVAKTMDALLLGLSYADVPGQRIAWPEFMDEENVSYWLDRMRGGIDSSSSPLDVAIDGHGFFRITSPLFDGIQYTRCGRLVRSESGKLCVLIREEEFPLDPPIMIPDDGESLLITPQGEVVGSTANLNGNAEGSSFRSLGFIMLAMYHGSTPPTGPGRFGQGESSGEEFYGMPGTEVGAVQVTHPFTHQTQERSLRVGLLRPFAIECSSVDAQMVKEMMNKLVDEMISSYENQ